MNKTEKDLLERIVRCSANLANISDFLAYIGKEHESFYLGEQWQNENDKMYNPVMNIVKRICDYIISTLCSKDFSVTYSLENAPAYMQKDEKLKAAIEALNKSISYKNDKETLEKLLFGMVRDAVIYGTGVLYTYWDTSLATWDELTGDMRTKVIEPYRVIPGDTHEPDVEKQTFFIIKGSALATSLASEARNYGFDILEDLTKESEGQPNTSYTLMLYKEHGTVHYIKESCGMLISYGDTRLTHYPIAVFTPIPKKNSFYGQSYVRGMIPNQKYINTSYSLLMKHMKDTAFSKVIYDRSRIPEWTGEPGVAIAAHGGGNLSDCVSVVGCGALEDGYIELTHDIAESTKELYGATETALGNVEPTNTSAIMAVKEASEGQLRGCIILLTSTLEEQARIWADMTCTYSSAKGRVKTGAYEEDYADLSLIKPQILRCRVSVSDRSKFGSSVTMAVLDRLLELGAISPAEYIKRLPDGVISDREGLIENALLLELQKAGKQTGKEE